MSVQMLYQRQRTVLSAIFRAASATLAPRDEGKRAMPQKGEVNAAPGIAPRYSSYVAIVCLRHGTGSGRPRRLRLPQATSLFRHAGASWNGTMRERVSASACSATPVGAKIPPVTATAVPLRRRRFAERGATGLTPTLLAVSLLQVAERQPCGVRGSRQPRGLSRHASTGAVATISTGCRQITPRAVRQAS